MYIAKKRSLGGDLVQRMRKSAALSAHVPRCVLNIIITTNPRCDLLIVIFRKFLASHASVTVQLLVYMLNLTDGQTHTNRRDLIIGMLCGWS